MYNTKYTCNYNDAKYDTTQDDIYRKDIMNIFMLDIFDETIINNSLNGILHKVKNHPELNKCMKQMAGLMISEDLGVGLLLLYSFDLLYLTHPCICEFLETETISHEKINPLLQMVC